MIGRRLLIRKLDPFAGASEREAEHVERMAARIRWEVSGIPDRTDERVEQALRAAAELDVIAAGHRKVGRSNPKPPPTPPTSPPSSGATMSASIGDAAQGIRAANDTANEACGILQQAIAQVEQARGQMLAAAAGSPQADVGEASGLFNRAIDSIQEAQRAVQAAIAAAASVAARL